MSASQNPKLFNVITHRTTVRRALTVSVCVGTVLLAINQIDPFLDGEVPPFWKVFLTYPTPYAASSYSTAVPVHR